MSSGGGGELLHPRLQIRPSSCNGMSGLIRRNQRGVGQKSE